MKNIIGHTLLYPSTRDHLVHEIHHTSYIAPNKCREHVGFLL